MVRALAVTALAALATSAGAADFWSKAKLSKSSWNSVYTTPNGEQVQAKIEFRGNEGTYTTGFGQGRLTNIQYGIDTNTNPDQPVFQITGRWAFQGENGTFLLASQGRDRFKGSWNGSIGSGKWNGTAMYGKWMKDPDKDRYFCEFRYPAKDNPSQTNVQTVLWYPNDPQRSSYYYFVNKQNKIWGRCLCPADSGFDPDTMKWALLDGNDWQQLPDGDCPNPKDGDPDQSSITSIPDPPV